MLEKLDEILEKYNALAESERSRRKLWQRIRFGNGEMVGVGDLRGKLVYYTSAMSLYLNMVSMGSIGRVEKHMNDHGGYLKDIKVGIHRITAHLLSKDNH